MIETANTPTVRAAQGGRGKTASVVEKYHNTAAGTITVIVKELHCFPDGIELKGFATVEIGPWTIYGCRIMQRLGQRIHVSLPQVQMHDGRFSAALSAPGLRETIQEAVLKAWDEEQPAA